MIIKDEIVIKVEYQDRIDKYISDHTDISRNDIKDIIKDYGVFVDETVEVRKPNFIVKPNHVIKITKKIVKDDYNLEPQNIPLDIVYEDEHIVVINKPSGMIVHPAPGNYDKSLVNALLYHFKNLSNLNGPIRPGIIHRIDKHTSGLLIVAKTNQAHRYFADLIKKHEVNREYLAIAKGVINNIIHIDVPIGRNPHDFQKMMVSKINSKNAYTDIYPIHNFDNKYTLVKCVLKTGRTHQIRVHLKYINHPVLGDDLYDQYLDEFRQRLHAYKLSFKHINGKDMEFIADCPKEFYENVPEIYKPN
ncbi:RluA family pseudouridine synthase [Metamycoplasma sualvi]|uniref:RluA family pseudouridine synthase n=1 Tax=Metamycoplasma sualvi TaxID=2125 RepID=UPI0038738CC7